jgi:PAT family beta-lactamase induction signal transducer AmpG
MTKQSTSRNPWSFLPTLYFAEGLPYVLINTVSVILYKRMGVGKNFAFFIDSFIIID